MFFLNKSIDTGNTSIHLYDNKTSLISDFLHKGIHRKN